MHSPSASTVFIWSFLFLVLLSRVSINMPPAGTWTYSRITVKTPGRTQCTLCTSDIVRALPGLKHVKQGLALLSVRDPSASVTVNENADPSGAAERIARQPELRGSVFGHCLTLPVRDGRFVFGTWQGIYLCPWANQNALEVDVVLVDGADRMATTTFQAPRRGAHPATAALCNALPSAGGRGLAHFLIKHTSAALCVAAGEAGVGDRVEETLNRVVPNKWNREFFTHTYEGDDDMPGHVKSSLVGPGVVMPVSGGQAALPGNEVYVCEHRDVGGFGGGHNRQIVATLLTADVTSSERKAINSGGQGLATQLRKDAPAIADVRVGWVNVCVLDEDAALALAQKGCNAEELSRKYKEIMQSDSESTAAVAGKSILLPVVDGKFTWEGDLDLFAIDCANGRKTVFDVHITVQGLTQ